LPRPSRGLAGRPPPRSFSRSHTNIRPTPPLLFGVRFACLFPRSFFRYSGPPPLHRLGAPAPLHGLVFSCFTIPVAPPAPPSSCPPAVAFALALLPTPSPARRLSAPALAWPPSVASFGLSFFSASYALPLVPLPPGVPPRPSTALRPRPSVLAAHPVIDSPALAVRASRCCQPTFPLRHLNALPSFYLSSCTVHCPLFAIVLRGPPWPRARCGLGFAARPACPRNVALRLLLHWLAHLSAVHNNPLIGTRWLLPWLSQSAALSLRPTSPPAGGGRADSSAFSRPCVPRVSSLRSFAPRTNVGYLHVAPCYSRPFLGSPPVLLSPRLASFLPCFARLRASPCCAVAFSVAPPLLFLVSGFPYMDVP